MLNGIKIRRLCRPCQYLNLIIFKLFMSSIRCMLWIIILLENDPALVQLIIADSLKKIVIKNAGIYLCIHTTINSACIPNSLSYYAIPHHQTSTTKFHCALNILVYQLIIWTFPCPDMAIRLKMVYFSLIRPNNTF